MAYSDKLVSELLSSRAQEDHQYYSSNYGFPVFKEFMAAVLDKIPGTEPHMRGNSSAYIYRPGDTHALGLIGWDDLRVKRNNSDSVREFYVSTRGITNAKYRSNLWQHHVLGYKSMKSAVKSAQSFLVPYTCAEAVSATRPIVKTAVNGFSNVVSTKFRKAMEKFTGVTYYLGQLKGAFWQEVRHMNFASPEVQAERNELFALHDAAEAVRGLEASEFVYVGFRDNYGQTVADVCTVHQLGAGYTVTDEQVIPFEALPEWMQGRIAVLRMIEAERYVEGVGVRIDDRIFYVQPEEVK